jgi:thiamine-phosphate pyrophosphorylase
LPKADLSECRLYGILDLSYVPVANATTVAEQMIDGGVDLMQLRGKNCPRSDLEQLAAALHDQTSDCGIPLVINDYPDIANALGAEGVHVGQDDLPVDAARAAAGDDCIVGKSTHSIDQAVRAAEEGAEYIGFGPLFATPTKPDYHPIGLRDIREVHSLVSIPIFCIGGIKLENLAQAIEAGAERVVIVSGLLQAANVANYAREAKALLKRQSKT